jgi:hypothetical protein
MPILVAGASAWLGSAVVAEVTLSQAAPGSSETVSPLAQMQLPGASGCRDFGNADHGFERMRVSAAPPRACTRRRGFDPVAARRSRLWRRAPVTSTRRALSINPSGG